MTQRERTEIIIETEHRLIIRHRRVTRRWCRACGHDTDFVSVEPDLYLRQGLPGEGRQPALHVDDGENGKRLVCTESLLMAAKFALEKKDRDSGLGIQR